MAFAWPSFAGTESTYEAWDFEAVRGVLLSISSSDFVAAAGVNWIGVFEPNEDITGRINSSTNTAAPMAFARWSIAYTESPSGTLEGGADGSAVRRGQVNVRVFADVGAKGYAVASILGVIRAAFANLSDGSRMAFEPGTSSDVPALGSWWARDAFIPFIGVA